MEHKLSQVIEAVLLSASRPIDVQEIERVFPEDESLQEKKSVKHFKTLKNNAKTEEWS